MHCPRALPRPDGAVPASRWEVIRLRQGVRLALKRCAAAADRLAPGRRGIVVLLYHRVGGGSGLAVDLPAGEFDDQMAVLAGRVLPLETALASLSGPAPASGEADAVVVTFDDGTADFAEQALPSLVRHRIPATLYLASGFVERGEAFSAARPLSWGALADCCATGLVTVGSHTHDHLLLDRTPAAVAIDDLDRSVGTIQDGLGVAPVDFAYPKALPARDAAIEAAIRRRFRSAAVAGTRPNVHGRTDPYRLARSPVQVDDGQRYFGRKVAGGMWFEDWSRRQANRVRYRGATT